MPGPRNEQPVHAVPSLASCTRKQRLQRCPLTAVLGTTSARSSITMRPRGVEPGNHKKQPAGGGRDGLTGAGQAAGSTGRYRAAAARDGGAAIRGAMQHFQGRQWRQAWEAAELPDGGAAAAAQPPRAAEAAVPPLTRRHLRGSGTEPDQWCPGNRRRPKPPRHTNARHHHRTFPRRSHRRRPARGMGAGGDDGGIGGACGRGRAAGRRSGRRTHLGVGHGAWSGCDVPETVGWGGRRADRAGNARSSRGRAPEHAVHGRFRCMAHEAPPAGATDPASNDRIDCDSCRRAQPPQ